MIYPLYFVVFIAFFGFAAAIPTFTNLLIQPTIPSIVNLSLSTRTVLLGSLLAMYPIGQFVGGSILGTFSDQIGRKKTLMITLILASISYLGIAYSLWNFQLILLFCFLFIGGLCEANVVVAQNAIADIVPPEQRPHKFGYIFAWINLGYISGATAGGFLSNPSFVRWFGPWTPFAFVFIGLILILIFVKITFVETFPESEKIKVSIKESLTNIKNIFTDKHLRFFYIVNALLYFSTYGYFRSYPMFISHSFNLKLSHLSIYMAYVGVPIVLFNLFFIRPLTRVFSAFFLTALCALLMGLSMCLIPAFDFISSLWFTLFLTTSFATVALTTCTSMISYAASDEEQGRVMGNNLSIQGGMTALSSVAGGAIASLGINWTLVAFGFIGVVTGTTLFIFRKKKEKIAHYE